jgi:hypothetical protein
MIEMKRLLGIWLLVIVVACNSNVKQKPTTVPKDAIWKGGVDGGCWILFGLITNSSIEATIFDESGEVWDRGIFKKHGNCQIPKEVLPEKIEGFDGKSLITSENCSFKK